MNLLAFLLCNFLIAISRSQAPSLVVELFRHGIRTPEESDYDSSWDSIGYGELTGPGMRQQYILGQALAAKYPSLLYPFSPPTIYVQTASENRTISSALAQLYGIYNQLGPNLTQGFPADRTAPPYYNDTVIDAIIANLTDTLTALPHGYLPVPLTTQPEKGDYILNAYLNCPSLDGLFYQHQNDSTVQEVYAELSSTVADLAATYKLSVNNTSQFDDLGDTVMADYPNNVPLPGNLSPYSQDYLDLVFFTRWYEIYPVLATQAQRQTFAGPFLYNLLNYFQMVQSGTIPLKFIFYAGKETMLSTILTAFGVMTPECLRTNWEYTRNNASAPLPYPECIYPSFAANLIFEFYAGANPYVVFKYNNNVQNICNDQPTCSLSDFETLLSNVTNGTTLANFFTVCGVNQTPIESMKVPTNFGANFSVLDIVLIAIVIIFTITIGVLRYIIRKSKQTLVNEGGYTLRDAELKV